MYIISVCVCYQVIKWHQEISTASLLAPLQMAWPTTRALAYAREESAFRAFALDDKWIQVQLI